MTLWQLVGAVSRKLNIPADRAWEMTLADLVLSIEEPDSERGEATDKIAQWIVCHNLDERLNLLAQLTREERIELENYKAEVM